MGAQLWHHIGPWHDDPAESLKQVQIAHMRAEYDYPTLLTEQLASNRDAVISSKGREPLELHDFYRDEVTRLERLAALPAAESPDDDIARLRALYRNSGEGIGCVLDVTHVSTTGGMHIARRLPAAEIAWLCGSDRPSLVGAGRAVFKINSELTRGDSVCFPVYDEAGRPVGWYFVGNTID